MNTIGTKIKAIRQEMKLKQGDLAKKLHMTSAQLCRIEGDKNAPSIKTLSRIASVLNISLSELMDENSMQLPTIHHSSDNSRQYLHASKIESEEIIAIRETDESTKDAESIVHQVKSKFNEYSKYMDELCVPSFTTLPIFHTYSNDDKDAELLATDIRNFCCLGNRPITDLVSILESKNIFIIPVKASNSVQSRAFYHRSKKAIIIAINDRMTPERQLYRISYELCYAILFGSNNLIPVSEKPGTHKFARRFAAAFLMPESSLRELTSQIAIGPNNWSFDLITAIKYKYGVASETFAHRLEKVGLISSALRMKLKAEIKHYYAENDDHEPTPSLKPLTFGSKLLLMKLRISQV